MKNKIDKICTFAQTILGGWFLGVLCFKDESGFDLGLTIALAIGNILFYTLDFRKANGTRST
jgi:hypothetical protein